MRSAAHTIAAFLVAACLLWTSRSGAADDVRLSVVVHPSRAGRLSAGEIRAIYLKQKLFWDDGRPIIPINLEAGSPARELFSTMLLGQDSRRLAAYWNQRYFEAGEFPPATLASEEAVLRFVAGNANAIGYVSAEDVGDSVSVAFVAQRQASAE
jgi:ABC-type phosphate transport system substrate-binding protein